MFFLSLATIRLFLASKYVIALYVKQNYPHLTYGWINRLASKNNILPSELNHEYYENFVRKNSVHVPHTTARALHTKIIRPILLVADWCNIVQFSVISTNFGLFKSSLIQTHYSTSVYSSLLGLNK